MSTTYVLWVGLRHILVEGATESVVETVLDNGCIHEVSFSLRDRDVAGRQILGVFDWFQGQGFFELISAEGCELLVNLLLVIELFAQLD